jgi:hypothetical protein
VALASLPIIALLRRGRPATVLAAILGVALVAPGVAGLLHRIGQNPYRNDYRPVIDIVRQYWKPGGIILAGSEFAFDLGFEGALVDDMEMRRDAQIYIANNLWRTHLNGPWQPAVRERLRREYREVYTNPRFRVYVRAGE